MKAVAIERFGGPEVMQLVTLPDPVAGPGEVLIRVAYAGVNPVDWKIREGHLKQRMPHQFPLVLGWDVAGQIVAVGVGVDRSRIGESVFSYVRKPIAQWGSFAELVAFEAQHVVPIPKKLTLRQAASIPLCTLTAWQAVVEWGQVQRGQSVLIQAGAGGVGGMAVQLAHHLGAHVTSTASEIHHTYVQRLGAERVIDYHTEKVTGSFDLVFDTVGGAVFEQCWSLVRPGGKLVSILEAIDPKRAQEAGIQGRYVFVRPDGDQLRQIARLLETGALQPPDIREFPLEQAADALEIQRRGHNQGKLVLKIPE
jgi:NADPH:quinone reductase-like Zn-dependent oxidoreductase